MSPGIRVSSMAFRNGSRNLHHFSSFHVRVGPCLPFFHCGNPSLDVRASGRFLAHHQMQDGVILHLVNPVPLIEGQGMSEIGCKMKGGA
jgi:hypothetical protein